MAGPMFRQGLLSCRFPKRRRMWPGVGRSSYWSNSGISRWLLKASKYQGEKIVMSMTCLDDKSKV